MPDYLNSNGLVRGLIPPRTPCPFFEECGRREDRCPNEINLKEHHFSCALARLHSIVKHKIEEGSREHVLSWGGDGERCYEPNCEINARGEKE